MVRFKAIGLEIYILFTEFFYLLPFENGTFGSIFGSQSKKQYFFSFFEKAHQKIEFFAYTVKFFVYFELFLA